MDCHSNKKVAPLINALKACLVLFIYGTV